MWFVMQIACQNISKISQKYLKLVLHGELDIRLAGPEFLDMALGLELVAGLVAELVAGLVAGLVVGLVVELAAQQVRDWLWN
jgi:hypothetical protein